MSNYPWEGRLRHEDWRVRYDANVDLAYFFYSMSNPNDPRLHQFGHYFKTTVADCNEMVQDKVLDALIAYLNAAHADSHVLRYAHEVCDALVENCLTGAPKKVVDKAQAVFLLWIELGAAQAFLDAMEKAIKNKVAVPAIDVMYQALSEFGSKVVLPERLLKMLPELFDHQDRNVCSSSKCLTFELCRWIGKDSVKSILFEKISDVMKKELEAELAIVTGSAKPTRKIRSERDKEPKPEPVVGSETAGDSSAKESIPDGIAEQSGYFSSSIAGRVFARETFAHPQLHQERNSFPRVHAGIHYPTHWNEVLDVIAYGSPEQSVEGMKAVCLQVEWATDAPEGSSTSCILKDVDQLTSILVNKVRNNFDSGSCKYVWKTLMKIFQSKTLAHAIQETTLETLIIEILLWLLDERVPCMVEGDLLLKDLNQLMHRILVNADRTSFVVVLFNLLHLNPLDFSKRPAPASNEAASVGSQEFFDIVVKFLVYLTRDLESRLSDVDFDRILESIHVFLEDLGLEEIRRRIGSETDKPLHLVLYFLFGLVTLWGTAIRGYLSKFPIDKEPQPIILAYLDSYLNSELQRSSTRLADQVQQVNSSASVVSSTPLRDGHTRTQPICQAWRLKWGASSVPLSTPSAALPSFPVISNSMCDSISHPRRVKPINIKLRPQKSATKEF